MENRKELRHWIDAFGLNHPLVIAGPCSAETEEQVLKIAHQLKDSDATVFRAGIWKPRTRPGNFEGVGASKFGSIFLYILVATIGMKMNIGELIRDWGVFKYLITIGLIWITIHAVFIFIIAKIIKAPFFYVAVGSQANVGGAASAPIVAGAFSPALAPVGVLLAVLGYAVGTFGAILCTLLMKGISI